VPLLSSCWHQQQQLSGIATASALLLASTQQGTHVQAQQLLYLAAHICSTAAAAAATAGGIHATASTSPPRDAAEALHVLSAAASAGLLAAGGQRLATQRSCVTPAEPVYCSSQLHGTLCAALQPSPQQPGRSSSSNPNSVQTSSAAASLAALLCVGTSGGQVWLCDPAHLLQQQQQPYPGVQPTYQQQGQQQQQAAVLQRSSQAMKLLLDVQQPVVAVLPASLIAGGAEGLLIVGSLGRLVLLQTDQQQQQQQQQPNRQHGTIGLTAQQQLQLPFEVTAAAVVGADSTQEQQPNQQQQQQEPQQLLANRVRPVLLLVTPSGQVHAADLTALQASDQPAAASATRHSGLLPLFPVQLALPGAVTRLWTLQQQQQQQQQQKQGSSSTGTANAPQGTRPNGPSPHSSVVMQLAGSKQLLELSLHDIAAAVATGAAAQTTPHSESTAAAAAAVGAARARMQELLSSLEIVAAAREQLEQAAAQQDTYLEGMQHDVAVLGLLQQSTGVVSRAATTGATTAAAAAKGLQQFSGQAAAAAAGTSSCRSSSGAGLQCSVRLHGLWPVLGASQQLTPGSSIHLAVSIHLQQSSSSGHASSACSNSRSFTGRLGPGWQLVVSFVPESAGSSSMQTTVDLSSCSSSDDGAMQASLLLQLPEGCAGLHEGGWITVYAVKQPGAPPGPAAVHSSYQGSFRQQQQQQRRHELVPVVTLLGQQYVSVLQLSSMAAANPAVKPLMPAGGSFSLQLAALRRPDSSSRTAASTGSSLYSCLMRLSAAPVSHAGQPGNEQDSSFKDSMLGTSVAGAQTLKRARHEAADAAADATPAGQQQQQQQEEDRVVQAAGHSSRNKSECEQAVSALQDWLGQVLCLTPSPTAPPPMGQQANSTFTAGGASSSRSSVAGWSHLMPLSSSTAASRLAAPYTGSARETHGLGFSWGAGALQRLAGEQRQGQALYPLPAGEVARVVWGFSAQHELPSTQLVDAAAGLLTAGTKRSAAAAAAAAGADHSSGRDVLSGASGPVSLSVQLQAGSVSHLASIHRALLLGLLQQLGAGCSSAVVAGSSSAGSSNRGADAREWHLVASVQQLKVALARLRQLDEHLLRLQGTADKARGLLLAFDRPVGGAAGWGADKQQHPAAATAAHVAAPEQAGGAAGLALEELAAAMSSLQQGLSAAYGRFLLAVSDAVHVAVG